MRPLRSAQLAAAVDTGGGGEGPPRLVHVRLMGPPEAVADMARTLRAVLSVADESRDYPRRGDLGVRRYLTVLPGSGLPPAAPAGRSPER